MPAIFWDEKLQSRNYFGFGLKSSENTLPISHVHLGRNAKWGQSLFEFAFCFYYSRLRNKYRGSFINLWKEIKGKKMKNDSNALIDVKKIKIRMDIFATSALKNYNVTS